MADIYQTSLVPEPLCLSRSDPVLKAASFPSRSHWKSLNYFLAGLVLLQIFLSIGGFIYLYHSDRMLQSQLPSGLRKAAQEVPHKALARMQGSRASDPKSTPGYLQWDISNSVLRSINYYRNTWLTILQPGDYYVYSRVTFFKGNSQRPVVSLVKLRKNETEEEKVVMMSYCNLGSSDGSALIPHLCTATQGEAIMLEKGNQISVWVQDLSLVNYEEGATSFGMFKL